jgi:hypothetical protein
VLQRRVAPKPVLALPSPPGVQAAMPADYIDVANKMLFSKDRNPTVVVEPPKAPPEPPMPALPTYSGQMAIGPDPVIFLNPVANVQRSYHAGEQVGDFKIVRFDDEKIDLEWNGKSIERKLEELRPKQVVAQAGGTAVRPPNSPEPAVAAAAQTSGPSNPVTSLGGSKPGDSNSGNDASEDGMLGPPLPGGLRSCVPADTSPAGTVHSGYRKVQSMSIFGASCQWEPTK